MAQTKTPERWLRGFGFDSAGCLVARRYGAGETEFVVDAELHRMDLLIDIGRGVRCERDGAVAEVHVVILELGGPGRREASICD